MTEQAALNAYVPEEERRVPFKNMLYFGDGDTDVPCMKLTKVNGGHSFVVYQKDQKEAHKLIEQGRVDFAVPADYSKGRELEKTVIFVMDEIVARHKKEARRIEQIKKMK